jgi:hypothetical protein
MAKPTAAQLKMYAKMGIAMPDESYYIRNAADLSDAIKAVGRGNADHNAIRKHIIARAKKLGLYDNVPSNWNPDGSEKLAAVAHDVVAAGQHFIAHFGVKGMKWGQRRPGTGTPSTHVSADHLRAQSVNHLIKTGGVKSASNDDLQTLITRLNLESQHARLTATPSRVDAGHNFIRKTLGLTKTGLDVAKTGLDVVETGRRVHKVATGTK